MTSSTTPTIWFSAPAVATNSPNAAGAQFMNLFNDPADWQVTAGVSAGFMLTETFVLQATTAQLTQVLNFLKAHNLKLAMVAGMVPVQANGVGNGQEGFTTAAQLTTAIQRISSLGGTLDVLGMDAPLYAGSESPSGARLSITALAQQIASNAAIVKAAFPNVQFYVGDGSVSTADLGQFAQAFLQATGSPITEFDADVNWNLPNWESQLAAYAAAAKASGASFGIAGNATNVQTTNLSWALAAESNIAAAAANPLIAPSNIIVQSWDANPTVILPEGLDGTLSHVAVEVSQFAPLYASHYLTGGSAVTVTTAVPAVSYVGSAADAVAGSAVALPGVAITASAPAGMTFAVVLTGIWGTLSASASGAGKVSGAGTGVMTLTGGYADINAELASLTYTGAAAGTDTIDVTTYDGVGLVDDHQIAVAVAAPVTMPLPANAALGTVYLNIYGHNLSTADHNTAKAQLAAGEASALVAAPWIAQGQATIQSLYEQVTGVSPTQAVLTTLTEALMGGESVAQIRTALSASAAVQSELATFYQSHYGQAPTAAQLTALTRQLASGTGLLAIEAPLLANSQAQAQVTSLFQQEEGQAPNTSDLTTDARALLTGTSLASLRNGLATSALVQANLSTLYQHVYDQTPTAAQLASLTSQLEATTTYAQIQAQFTAVAQAAVTGFFQSVLNRNPTASELTTDTQNLVAGNVSRSALLAGLAYSAQSGTNVTALYQQVTGQAPPRAMVTELEQCLCIGSNPIPLAQLGTDIQSAATIYQQITGQPVTAAAMTPLMYDFLNQASISQIRFWVGFSGQEIGLIKGLYQGLFGASITAATLNSLETALVAGTTTMAGVRSALTAQAAADVPVISDVAPAQIATVNSNVLIFGAIDIADPVANATETVTVSLTGAGHLAMQGTAIGVTPASYTVQGTPAHDVAYLRDLMFVPPAGGGTSQISIAVRNGAGNSTSGTVAITSETLRSPAVTTFLYAPTQAATLPALYPAETIVFPAAGFGTDTITGFSLTQGIIELPKAIAATFAAVQSHTTASAGGTLMSFGASESIFLPGIAPSALHAANFSFV